MPVMRPTFIARKIVGRYKKICISSRARSLAAPVSAAPLPAAADDVRPGD
jgi:hypothetical protein